MVFYSHGKIFAPEVFALTNTEIANVQDLLLQLGLRKIERVNNLGESMMDIVSVYSDSQWIQIASLWSLYYIKNRQDIMRDLSKGKTAIYFSMGDCDIAYEFTIFKDGKIIRDFNVASPNFHDHIVTRNHGDPLPNEAEYFNLVTGDMIPEDSHNYTKRLYGFMNQFGLEPPPINAQFSYYRHANVFHENSPKNSLKKPWWKFW